MGKIVKRLLKNIHGYNKTIKHRLNKKAVRGWKYSTISLPVYSSLVCLKGTAFSRVNFWAIVRFSWWIWCEKSRKGSQITSGWKPWQDSGRLLIFWAFKRSHLRDSLCWLLLRHISKMLLSLTLNFRAQNLALNSLNNFFLSNSGKDIISSSLRILP